ncbi:hypothetical protein BGZ95_003342 [Linnemannia exigua]|uniref:Uncharacterized protein n=1 Tax=Linnemannia exigua TaxID=604196 RepID=A0AAD4DI48_9FUNG|nr:hypothetical protein BGZ95_003342 [Linnemannia exigua]
MPPKRPPAGSAIGSRNQAEKETADVATLTDNTLAQRRSSVAARDVSDEHEKRPSKKPRGAPGKKSFVVKSHSTPPDASQGQEQHHSQVNADEDANNDRTLSGQEQLHHNQSMTNGGLPRVKKPFKPRGPRGPYKPRQPKINTTVPVLPRAVPNGSTPKPSSELAFKDARPWHDYFVKRIPTFNQSSSMWEFCPPSPREDVLAPEELDKMIMDDYSRMKPLPNGGSGKYKRLISHQEGGGIGGEGTEDEPLETGTHEQHSPQPCNNDASRNKKNMEKHDQAQEAGSDSQWDDSGSDSDDIEDAGNNRSQSLTPGPSGDGNGNDGLRRRVSKHRPRIKYRFPAPIPPLEYPYLQAPFPYEGKQPPKQHALTQTDYGDHSKPLPDLWHRPQGNFALEDLFSQDKLDYSIKMLRRQPIESNKLRLDLYYRRMEYAD